MMMVGMICIFDAQELESPEAFPKQDALSLSNLIANSLNLKRKIHRIDAIYALVKASIVYLAIDCYLKITEST